MCCCWNLAATDWRDQCDHGLRVCGVDCFGVGYEIIVDCDASEFNQRSQRFKLAGNGFLELFHGDRQVDLDLDCVRADAFPRTCEHFYYQSLDQDE